MENLDKNKKGIKKPNKVLIELTPRGEGGNGGRVMGSSNIFESVMQSFQKVFQCSPFFVHL